MPKVDDRVPSILQSLHTDEYSSVPATEGDHRGAAAVLAAGEKAAGALGLSVPEWAQSRFGTAAGLRALNDQHGDTYYVVPEEAEIDRAAVDETFNCRTPVIDVQTHFLSDRAGTDPMRGFLHKLKTYFGPDWWHKDQQRYHLDEYFRCTFMESETAIAVLTSAPSTDGFILGNDEMAATRELIDRLGGAGRLYNHTVVRAQLGTDLDEMATWSERYQTVGWKVYTMGLMDLQNNGAWVEGEGWYLDDEKTGIPFLERVREVGPKRVVSHKGISELAPTSSPRDVGPAAAMFPDIQFLIYHSGAEVPVKGGYLEGPYTPETADRGSNRLITSLRQAGIRPGSNVYAEIGTTWFLLIKRPLEAAHLLGKLLLAVGEDNVLWGTDGCWYGPSQPLIDAFRAFQVPAHLRDEFGYPELTPELKDKILCHNACGAYGFDVGEARRYQADDDVEWARAAMREFQERGAPTLA